jgi:DNA invertase Pin-like site-specific DNA recombinase
MGKKAYGYIRVSGKGQVDGDGLIRQEKAIRDYAKANEITIERIFREEGVSGTDEIRPALAELMLSLEENGDGIKTVLIERVDRLARDLMIQEAIINDLKKSGFDLISVIEGDDLLSDDPTRKLVRQVLGAIAEYDKSMTVMKLRAARDRKRALKGKCEGRKAYMEVMPEVVREIKRLRRKRKGLKRRTFRQIAEELNQQGLKTMTGKIWTGQLVQNVLRRK